ncbi:MAG: 3-deoxy-7-phosphoheptulonate synthase, partial [Caldimicrobium sp.]
MIIILEPNITQDSQEFKELMEYLNRFPHLQVKVMEHKGVTRNLIEVHLIGEDYMVSQEEVENLPGVEKAIKVTAKYRLIGRHGALIDLGFEYMGLQFNQENFLIFAGQCAVDTYENAEAVFKALKEVGLFCELMG